MKRHIAVSALAAGIAGAVAGLVVAALVWSGRAEALASSLGQVRSWEITCPASAGGISLAPASGYRPRGAFKIKNTSASTVYIGAVGSVDATTNGYPVEAGSGEPVDSAPGLWGCITGGGSAVVEVIGGTQ